MQLKNVSLSIYSFGYAAGFIKDERPEAAAPVVTLENIGEFALRYGLGGIEFPVDRYFPLQSLGESGRFIKEVHRRGLSAAVDLETFEPNYIRGLLPVLADNGIDFARIKMSGIYGGSRYAEPRFADLVDDFVAGLRELLPDLRHRGIRLLIENHQDLGSDDLIAVIGATCARHIGITWDMGNSLAVIDTPEGFLHKAAGFIGNVHLKDYRLCRGQGGVRLVRCALGDGVVDFPRILPALKSLHGTIPMAIELGAQKYRQADVFKPEYWRAYPPQHVDKKADFFSMLLEKALPEDASLSPWERGLPGQVIIESELDDLERSVAYLRRLDA